MLQLLTILFYLLKFSFSERRYLSDCCIDKSINFDITSIGNLTYSSISIDNDNEHHMTLNLCTNVQNISTPSFCYPPTTVGPTLAIDEFYDGGYHTCWWVGDSTQCEVDNTNGFTLFSEGKPQSGDNQNVRSLQIHFICDKASTLPVVDITHFETHQDTPIIGATTTVYFMSVKTSEVCSKKPSSKGFFVTLMAVGGILFIVIICGSVPLCFIIIGLIILFLWKKHSKEYVKIN